METNESPEINKSLRDLLSIGSQIRDVVANEQDFTPELLKFLALKTDDTDLAIAQKVDAIAFVLDDLDGTAKQLRARADMNYQAAKRFEKAKERLERYLKDSMEIFKRDEIMGHDQRFVLSACAEKLVITDEAILPKEYIQETVIREPKKAEIKAALANMELIPGARLEGGRALRRYAAKPKSRGKNSE